MLYPNAEWVPWKYVSPAGQLTYYKGSNRPIAAVLHIAQGWASTARQRAKEGHFGASWHFTVGLDGKVMQHLDFDDGGYHAGIGPGSPVPAWSLWKGHNVNVNNYTIGIEHEGFSGDAWPDVQRDASKALCKWIAKALDVPYARAHFPPHADIDLLNRPNDFGPPAFRAQHYQFMFMEEEMPDPRLDKVIAALGGEAAIDEWNTRGNSLLLGFANDQERLGQLETQHGNTRATLDGHLLNSGDGTGVPEHSHTPGGVAR